MAGLSPDLKRVTLTEPERAALLAFLATLSSENPPVPAPLVAAGPISPPAARDSTAISQKDKLFQPSVVRIRAGQSLTILNDDVRTHNIRLDTGPRPFNSGAQEPGQSVTVPFARPGQYELYCGIHPTMRLDVSVER